MDGATATIGQRQAPMAEYRKVHNAAMLTTEKPHQLVLPDESGHVAKLLMPKPNPGAMLAGPSVILRFYLCSLGFGVWK
ncbi:hypothetical protein Aspvir_010189 [Aspergillus viridinutans]|uniref:Uncharacterized protein n=1 Tax=Aspergillus viridinutans TaxID=75553 RepID=A0A9P3F9J8_ASPVI|nr:uncharacterized protein Aspvir_010189 [Aspergillus viridinutans]GIK06071.1 hypothetical protein Aspvir_010189 [Aspergillus viridinutans]